MSLKEVLREAEKKMGGSGKRIGKKSKKTSPERKL